MSREMSIFTLAGFNLQNFNAVLKKEFAGATLDSVDYGQLLPFLLKNTSANVQKDLCICWLTPKDIEQAGEMNLSLPGLLADLERSFRFTMIILPVIDSQAYNLFQAQELRNKIYQLNASLGEKISGRSILLLDPTPWLIGEGAQAISDSLWYLSKTPFHTRVLKQAAVTCKSAWDAWTGHTKKVLVLDLDDTLWGGLVGEEGWESLKLGGHDALGEAFADFQLGIKKLREQGVILCICSKNDEKNAWEAIEKHSGMVLQKEDFVKWRINWNDKAENISEMIKELNVGMDSVVFFDDSAAERNRVRTALPGIFVPDLPEDKMKYPSFLRSLLCFNRLHITEEDKNRTALYQQEEKRSGSQKAYTSHEEWVKSLQVEVHFEPLNSANITRAEQLLNKTNQMNLRTRRMTQQEMLDWCAQPLHAMYVVYVKDIFGDNGITGLVGFHETGNGEIFTDDFVMSCRIMGREVENRMLEFLRQKAADAGKKLIIEYIPTAKNKPVRDFIDQVRQ